MARLFNLFKELGLLKTEGVTEAELKKIEEKADAVEAAIVADAKAHPEAKPEPKPEAKPEAKPGEKAQELDPALKAEIDGMKNTIAEMVKSQTERAESEKKAAETAQRDAYKTHVTQLVKDGKITRAKGEEWLKDEAIAKNAPALDTFKTVTADLPVDPKIKTANSSAQPAAATQPAQPANGTQPVQGTQPQPMGAAINIDKLTQDAKAEAASFLE